jgi:predicted TPR repeat methyltransferase
MVFERLHPGQSVLDLGIGTGLAAVLLRKAGLTVHGLDLDEDMLGVCRWKGFENLKRHDLTTRPYPYATESFDHVVCVGVLPFLPGPLPVFGEATRVLRAGGAFVFMVLDRAEDETFELVLGPTHTKTDQSVTMYRHSGRQVAQWLEQSELEPLRSLPFTVYRDSGRTEAQQAVCYVAAKSAGLGRGKAV